jgi:hypothetical protein
MHWAGWSLVDRPGAEAGNLSWLRYWYLTNPLISWPRILAVMLAGVLAERDGLITRLRIDRVLAWRLRGATAPVVLAGRVLLLLAPVWIAPRPTVLHGIAVNLIYHIAAWSLTAVYVAALALV